MGRAAQYLPWRPHHHHPWKQDSTPGVREPVIRLGTATVCQAVERIKTDGQLGHFFLSDKLVQIGEGQAFRRWRLKERDFQVASATGLNQGSCTCQGSQGIWFPLAVSRLCWWCGGVPGSCWRLEPSGPLWVCWNRNSASSPSPFLPPPQHSPGNPVEILPPKSPPALQEALASP